MILNIAEFCDLHSACEQGRVWAIANCTNMADAWEKLQPEWLVWVATRPGVLDDKRMRLFACKCARETPIGDGRTTWDLLTDPRSRSAIEVSERFLRGEATEGELSAASSAASAASAAWSAQAAWLRESGNPFDARAAGKE